MPILRYLRRKWITRRPFPEEWQKTLNDRVPFYPGLSAEIREKLHRRMIVFLDEKLFEGCGGLELTEKMRLVVAAHACLLILEEPSDYYSGLSSILIYPKDYVAPVYEVAPGGVVTEGWEPRSGESWSPGIIVLSWDDVRRDLRNPSDGRNLVWHEFAHQLDYRYGLSAGIDPEGTVEHGSEEDEWTTTLSAAYQRLRRKARRREQDVLDHYGSVSPAECFAVATECFLEKPRLLQKQYPGLYRGLETFYGFDPVLILG
ncbi:MAG: M90 family metallopeptidase [Balneolaceae bacterium]|nr:M90 family metallopeptidase [Balneolaceae bacterium]